MWSRYSVGRVLVTVTKVVTSQVQILKLVGEIWSDGLLCTLLLRRLSRTLRSTDYRCVETGLHPVWTGRSGDLGTLLMGAIIGINTRTIQVHGFTPSDILFGFNAKFSWNGVTMLKHQFCAKFWRWCRKKALQEPEYSILKEMARLWWRWSLIRRRISRNQRKDNRRQPSEVWHGIVEKDTHCDPKATRLSPWK